MTTKPRTRAELEAAGHTIEIEDWSQFPYVPINERFRAVLDGHTPRWRIFYGETREEALAALEASL